MTVVGSVPYTFHARISYLIAALAAAPAEVATPTQRQSNEAMTREAQMKEDREREESFLKIVEDYEGIIFSICRSHHRLREDQKDLHQEIVVQLWQAYPGFKGESKLSTWIYTVALRTAMMPFRRKGVKIETRETLPDFPADEAPASMLEEEWLLNRFHHLGNSDQAILTLMLEGYSRKEIGAMLLKDEYAVNTRLNRLKKIFKH